MGNPLIHKIFFRGGQRPAAAFPARRPVSLASAQRGGCASRQLDMQLITLTNARYLDRRTSEKEDPGPINICERFARARTGKWLTISHWRALKSNGAISSLSNFPDVIVRTLVLGMPQRLLCTRNGKSIATT